MNRHATHQGNKKLFMVFVVLLGSFIATLTETLLNNALPAIMQEIHVTQLTVQWLSTGYLLVAGIMMPTAAYFTTRFKLKPLFLGTLTIFLLGIIVSATAASFTQLFIGRIIQAISVGIIMPLVQNILTLAFSPENRGIALGVGGVVITLGPALGPTISGVIVHNYSWRMLFIILIPIIIIVILLGSISIENITKTRPVKLDINSVLLSTIGFGSLLYSVSTLGDSNFQLKNLLLLLFSIIVIAIFSYRQLHVKNPLLQLKVFKALSFRRIVLLAALTNIALMGPELIIPLYNQNLRQVDAITSGLIMLPGALLSAILSPISGNIFDRIGFRKISLIGFGLATLFTIPMIWFNATTSIWAISLLYAIRISGLTLVFMQVSASGLNALSPKYLVYGSTIIITIQQIASSLGSALLVMIVSLGKRIGLHSGLSLINATTVGFKWAFILTLVFTAICLVYSFLIKNKTTIEI